MRIHEIDFKGLQLKLVGKDKDILFIKDYITPYSQNGDIINIDKLIDEITSHKIFCYVEADTEEDFRTAIDIVYILKLNSLLINKLEYVQALFLAAYQKDNGKNKELVESFDEFMNGSIWLNYNEKFEVL